MGRRQRRARRSQFESFEKRQVLSSMPLGDFLLEGLERPPLEHFAELAPSLADVHSTSGVSYVHNSYGFSGAGQTVAVIDSGIAWDHQALGGGFGAGYRVVGGWDFTEENDANPYDDGPAGFHGTHVAGIIGSSNTLYRGVAPGVDLVALRVFNDQGSGYFSWVEKALQWVHQNRNAFENPITTVNLSLGTQWNSNSVPSWSTLEDEFAQLEADGIFVAVAAGNAFGTYQSPGLSYPASSPYVVPVSSVTNAGVFSTFSQRHARVLAAPGQAITSTVPDHVYGSDGVANDFGTASGTSMASPYVAGTAALVREAMQFVGINNITQDMIYDHLRSTADILHDSVTNADYFRINVGRAIDALMPADDYGSTAETAHQLGSLLQTQTISGTIGKLTDTDLFQFTAAVSGTLTLSVESTGQLDPRLALNGSAVTLVDNSVSVQVQAGQSYSLSVSTGNGIGHFEITLGLQSTIEIVDWGTVQQKWILDQQVTGSDTYYQVTAVRNGQLSIEAFQSGAPCNATFEISTIDGQLLGSSQTSGDSQRLDISAQAGKSYLLHFGGQHHGVDLRITNLLSIDSQTLVAYGTGRDDIIQFDAANRSVTINNVSYSTAGYGTLRIEAGAGQDTVTVLENDGGNAIATLRDTQTTITNGARSVVVQQAEQVTVTLTGGVGSATLWDTSGNDTFTVSTSLAEMNGSQVTLRAVGFRQVLAIATSGQDTAHLYDTAANDTVTAGPQSATLAGSGYQFTAQNFDNVTVDATSGGIDTANLTGSAQNDNFEARPTYSILSGSGYRLRVNGFDSVAATGAGGKNTAAFYDSAGNDVFQGSAASSRMEGFGYSNVATGFASVTVTSSAGGNDRAELTGTAGNDSLTIRPGAATFTSNKFNFTLTGFYNVLASAGSAGNDVAVLYDSIYDDQFIAGPDGCAMSSAYYYAEALGFSVVEARAEYGGVDTATFYDSSGDDSWTVRDNRAVLSGTDYRLRAFDFELVTALAQAGGFDRAFLYDTSGDDLFVAEGASATLSSTGRVALAEGFGRVTVFASDGFDRAEFYDTDGNDNFQAHPNRALMAGAAFRNIGKGFDVFEAFSHNGGGDIAHLHGSSGDDQLTVTPTHVEFHVGAVVARTHGFAKTVAHAYQGQDSAEFWDSAADDVFSAFPAYAIMSNASYTYRANNFNKVTAHSVLGGADTAALHGSSERDVYLSEPGMHQLTGRGYANRVVGFASIEARGRGGNDRARFFALLGQHELTVDKSRVVANRGLVFELVYGFEEILQYAPAEAASGAFDRFFYGY